MSTNREFSTAPPLAQSIESPATIRGFGAEQELGLVRTDSTSVHTTCIVGDGVSTGSTVCHVRIAMYCHRNAPPPSNGGWGEKPEMSHGWNDIWHVHSCCTTACLACAFVRCAALRCVPPAHTLPPSPSLGPSPTQNRPFSSQIDNGAPTTGLNKHDVKHEKKGRSFLVCPYRMSSHPAVLV
ncbi:hypothetical protein LZ30DRAFT_402947 [Colletotrichum cereale]|nr:hypothetical protein LZ30DRAFT_402947 [Colletotrichum cereale]